VRFLSLIDPADGPTFTGALCAQTDPEIFFPDKGERSHEAKALCMGCEHLIACQTWALENDERFGVWGGLSEADRKKIRKGAA
jgi:WhiB family redox-sensing transcriptional regulator